MGFKITQNINLQGRQTDIWCQQSNALYSARIIIECKSTKKTDTVLGSRDVTDFCARVNLARSTGRADFGWLVTNKTISQLAEAVVLESNLEHAVKLFTLDDLIDKSIDITQYLGAIKSFLEKKDPKYVDPHLESYNGRLRDLDKSSLDSVMNDWVNHPRQTFFLLLGDYGQGKTSFCYNLLRNYIKAEGKGRIPLYIKLRDVANQGYKLATVLRVALQERFGLFYDSYETLDTLASRGRFIFIFDGLDEITLSLRWNEIYTALAEIVPFAKDNNKVIITSRPGIFQTEKNALDILSKLTNDQSKKYFSVAKISYFDKPKIVKYLKLAGVTEYQSVAKHLMSLPDIADLVRRPFTLQMVAETIATNSFSEEDISSSATLYEKYTASWLHRDSWRSRIATLSSSDSLSFKEHFVQLFAWNMFLNRKSEIDVKFVEQEVYNYFGSIKGSADLIPEFVNEIRICSFLDTLPNGALEFSHFSFFNFFIAKYLSNQNEALRIQLLSDHNFDITTLRFLIGLIDWEELSRRDNHHNAIAQSANYCLNTANIIAVNSSPLILNAIFPNGAQFVIDSPHAIVFHLINSTIENLTLTSSQASEIMLKDIQVENLIVECEFDIRLSIISCNIQKIKLKTKRKIELNVSNSEILAGNFFYESCSIISTEQLSRTIISLESDEKHVTFFEVSAANKIRKMSAETMKNMGFNFTKKPKIKKN